MLQRRDYLTPAVFKKTKKKDWKARKTVIFSEEMLLFSFIFESLQW
jgi:hypothetical protein